jgi:hypothetical protein
MTDDTATTGTRSERRRAVPKALSPAVRNKEGRVMSPRVREVSPAYLATGLAQTAPVKMAIPLALFIFPVIFIVIFGPILLKFLMGTM